MSLKFTPLEFEAGFELDDFKMDVLLKFTPLEFETQAPRWEFEIWYRVKIYSVGVWNTIFGLLAKSTTAVKIYSVGVWNKAQKSAVEKLAKLKFTPLEFETRFVGALIVSDLKKLKFTPLEFETMRDLISPYARTLVKIYSVGVWN